MSRCYFPVWREHQRQFVERMQRNGKLILLLNVSERALGIDLDYATKFFSADSVDLDANKLADIFKEDIFVYTDRITNSERSVEDILRELDNRHFLENLDRD